MYSHEPLNVVDALLRHGWRLLHFAGRAVVPLRRDAATTESEGLPRHKRWLLFGGLLAAAITIISLFEGSSWLVYQHGEASWYGPDFHNRPTAGGERFNMYDTRLTAAHPTLPLGCYVLVKNRLNGREALVRINDRGPYAKGRIIDLNRAAAERLDIVGRGMAPVTLYLRRYNPDATP